MFSVIDLSQENQWMEWLSAFPEKDVYYLPAYCRVCMDHGDGYPRAAYYKNKYGMVFYAFMERDIQELSLLNNDSEWTGYKDIITPYGYGGPIVCCDDGRRDEVLASFREKFDLYCIENKIVSEFIRFHPLLSNHLGYNDNIEVKFNRHTIAVDLRSGQEQIWNCMKKNYRNRLRKAVKSGVTVDFSDTKKDLEEFIRLYYLTMDKNNANKYYYFDEHYFHTLKKILKNNFVIANARMNGNTIASGLILCCGSIMNFHLEGSEPEKLCYAPNNLLQFEISCFGIKKGFKYLHLGGGRGSNDSLFDYKKAFAPNGLREFWIGQKIHLEEPYRLLENLWNKYKNIQLEKAIDFFPVYRA